MADVIKFPDDRAAEHERLRYARASSWAIGTSLGPWGQGLPEDECWRIEALRDEILAETDQMGRDGLRHFEEELQGNA